MGRTRRVSVYILSTTALGGKKKQKIEQKEANVKHSHPPITHRMSPERGQSRSNSGSFSAVSRDGNSSCILVSM